MKKNGSFLMIACLLLCVTGCASSRIAELEAENTMISKKNDLLKKQVTRLERDKSGLASSIKKEVGKSQKLEKTVDQERRIGSLLKKEKTARASETADVRREVREYLKSQMIALRKFSEDNAMLDYVGSEVIKRADVDGSDELLLDLANPMPANATLLGVRLYASKRGKVVPCLLRPAGNDYVVIWIGEPQTISKTGVFVGRFDVPVSAQKKDIFGVLCKGAVVIPFDSGTGLTGRMITDIDIGTSVLSSKLNTVGSRSYSFGATGLILGTK